jgi:hypothetical protein
VSRSWRAQTPRTPFELNLDASHREFVGNALAAVTRMLEAVIEDRLLDLVADAVGVGPRAGEPADQAVGTEGLVVAADLVELLARVPHHLAGRECSDFRVTGR